jgi:L-glyceraldehyde reductase
MPVAEGKTPEQTVIDDKTSIVDTWKAMTKLPKSKARAVGVSNFTKAHLEHIINATGEVPACDQVERHPRLQDRELLEYCKSKKIAVVAYSPLGNNMCVALPHPHRRWWISDRRTGSATRAFRLFA